MKLETYLNAMQFAQARYIKGGILHELDPYSAVHINLVKLDRQFNTFRARILKMDADKDKRIKDLLADYASCYTKYKTSKDFLAMRDREIVEKDKRIADMLQNCDYKSGICT